MSTLAVVKLRQLIFAIFVFRRPTFDFRDGPVNILRADIGSQDISIIVRDDQFGDAGFNLRF